MLYGKWVKLLVIPHILSDYIISYSKFTSYFNDYLKALDNTYIPAYISRDNCRPYQNQNRCLTQNIVVACNFETYFCYILPEYKSSTHDSWVLKNTTDRKRFVVLKKKYWLRDAGYLNCDHLLIFNKKMRYHLKEILFALQKSKNIKELFNLHHFNLNNVTKRIFGIVKKRFPCLKIVS